MVLALRLRSLAWSLWRYLVIANLSLLVRRALALAILAATLGAGFIAVLPAPARAACFDCTPKPGNQAPTASFTFSPASPGAGGPLTFNGSASNDNDDGGGIATYHWDFGDGSTAVTSATPTTTHTYASPGAYTATLTVTDNDAGSTSGGAKTGTTSHQVTVHTTPIASVTGSRLTFSAVDGGGADTITASYRNDSVCPPLGACTSIVGAISLTDSADAVRAGDGCSQTADAHTVSCDATYVACFLMCPGGPSTMFPKLSEVRVEAKDGADHVDLSGLPSAIVVPGGSTSLSSVIDGGPGDDTIVGGGSTSTIDYGSRTAAVTVDLGAHTGGQAGEHDSLTGIQNIRGGSGADVLSGDDGDNAIDGGAGADHVNGAGGTDTADYSSRQNAVTVTLANGSGTGGESGEGDVLSGIDSVAGGAGDDTITTRDSSGNNVSCGAGVDHVRPDKHDAVNSDCDHIDPFEVTAPTLSGTTRDGETLTADPGTWGGSPLISYQWRRCASGACSDIPGATGQSYTLGHDDVGKTDFVHVSATNDSGSDGADSDHTSVVAPAPPLNTSPPVVSGTLIEGQTLTTTDGAWSGSPATYSYHWRRCDADGAGCVDIPGATSHTYTLVHDDALHRIRAHVTATNAAATGGVSVDSAATSAIQGAPPAPGGTGSPSSSGSSGGSAGSVGAGAPSSQGGSGSSASSSGPGPSGAGSPSLVADTTAPTVTVAVVPKQKRSAVLKKGLKLSISCSEACSFTIQGLLDRKTAARLHIVAASKAPVILAAASGHTTARGKTVFVLRLSKKAKAAFTKLGSVRLTLSTTARDAAGNRSRARVTKVKI